MASNWYKLSSIAKKIYTAAAGLFLIIFLVVHLSINLCLLRSDGGEWFTAAATFMSNNYIVKVFEVFLFAGFILHILLGIIIQIQNWFARPHRYKVEGYSHTSFFSKFMIHTGIIIFIFLCIHMTNFYFVKLGWSPVPDGAADKHDFYGMADLLFSNANYAVLYIVFMIFLGFHLNHAFQSAFQTLGLVHNKYTPFIKFCGHVYSIIVPMGFIVIPLSYLL
ncbi:MAG: succinate dehydrogenase cytochrome b subunit [Bacteroidetes bacterium]|nr:succinate dehydrogenase cytochrome b subunit [Bacteroidota bacterium]